MNLSISTLNQIKPTTGFKPLRSFWSCISLLIALYLMNFALTFHNIWPTLAITTHNDLSVEIAALIFLMSMFTFKFGKISSRIITVLAIVLTLMAMARYIEVTAPALFGRRVNLYWDAQYLPHVAEMMLEVASPLQILLVSAGGVLMLTGIYYVLRYCLVRVTTALNHAMTQWVLSISMAILMVGYTMGHINQPIHTLKFYALPLTKTYWEQLEFISSVLAKDINDFIPQSDPLVSYDLSTLNGEDLIVQFIESYGATAYDTPVIADKIAADRFLLEETVKETGRRVVSGFIKPPTFGGNSWLSHASFMTGLNIEHLSIYELMVTQDRHTLADLFNANGYRSIALMPGIKTEWPEGSFYGFDQIYGEQALDYQGPDFGWWRIPDQYSLARITNLEMEQKDRKPLFLFFTTITPHMPFKPTPPYQADWSRIITETPYDETDVKASLSQRPEWTNLQPAYADTLSYTFKYLAGYLREQPDKKFTWVVLGDHQPPASVSGQDVRWDVPVHIISDNNEIIESLINRGFVEGMIPSTTPIDTMHQLPLSLLKVFSGP